MLPELLKQQKANFTFCSNNNNKNNNNNNNNSSNNNNKLGSGVGPVGLRLSRAELNAPTLHEFRVAPWASASSPKLPCQDYVHVGGAQ